MSYIVFRTKASLDWSRRDSLKYKLQAFQSKSNIFLLLLLLSAKIKLTTVSFIS